MGVGHVSWRDVGRAAGEELGGGLAEAILEKTQEADAILVRQHAARMAELDRLLNKTLEDIGGMEVEKESAGTLTPESIRRAYDRG